METETKIRFEKLADAAKVPVRATEGSAGYDLFALEDVTVRGTSVTRIRTGIRTHLPRGVVGRICERSGLALKGLCIRAGVIDSDYEQEICVLANCTGADGEVILRAGDRCAQMLFMHVLCVDDDVPAANVRTGGFGSTGK